MAHEDQQVSGRSTLWRGSGAVSGNSAVAYKADHDKSMFKNYRAMEYAG